MLRFFRSLWHRPRAQVPPELRLSAEAVTSTAIHGFYQFGASMSGVFLNLYLWRLTEDLVINALYSLIAFAVSPVGFAVGGKLVKTRDRLVAYRAGIAMTALFYLLVIVAGTAVVKWYWLFGFMSGVASSFYWVGYLTLMYDVSTETNRIRFIGLNSIAFNAGGLAGPALAGTIIGMSGGLSGYMTVFTLSFFMFLLAALGSFRLKPAVSHHRAYYLKMMPLLYAKNGNFRRGLYGWLLIGLYQGLMLLLPNILLYKVLESERLVGYLGAAFLGLTMLTSYGMSRFGRPEKARMYVLISSLAFGLGSLLLIGGYRVWIVLAFLALYHAFVPLQHNTFSAHYYNLVGKLPLKGNLRVETIVGRETFLNLGRIASIFVMLLLSENLESPWIVAIILLTTLAQFPVIWLVGGADGGKGKAADGTDGVRRGKPRHAGGGVRG